MAGAMCQILILVLNGVRWFGVGQATPIVTA